MPLEPEPSNSWQNAWLSVPEEFSLSVHCSDRNQHTTTLTMKISSEEWLVQGGGAWEIAQGSAEPGPPPHPRVALDTDQPVSDALEVVTIRPSRDLAFWHVEGRTGLPWVTEVMTHRLGRQLLVVFKKKQKQKTELKKKNRKEIFRTVQQIASLGHTVTGWRAY